MKKKLIVLSFLFFLSNLLFGDASFFLGGFYGNFNGNDWGVEGSINTDFMKDAYLSAAIDYRQAKTYSMSFTADYTPSIFIMGGGLDFKINMNGVYPGLKANLGIKIKEMLRFSIYGTIGINASDVSAPTMFELGLNSQFIAPYTAFQLKGFFSQENNQTYLLRNASGEFAVTLYKKGFLYSLKAGVIGEYSGDTRQTMPHNLSLKAVVGVGKNKDSGTFAIQVSMNIVTIFGEPISGFSVSIGKFPGKTSYIF
ncbi:MAG: hypothetical protein K5930_00910 [Treponemataceae bacterium]|nr:hypothetical protein [Treponemataceae bacterium]